MTSVGPVADPTGHLDGREIDLRPRSAPPAPGDAPVARRVPAWSLSVLLAVLYLVLDPPSADLSAQTYRTWIFEHAGFAIWDNAWYAGHHLPGYSVLFPPLAGLLGPRAVGALSAVAAAYLGEKLLGPRAPRPAAWWFSAATAVSLVSGRLTFALGLALGVGALLALARGPYLLAVALAVLTGLASPVAAAFLALLAGAWWWQARRARLGVAAAVAAGAVGPVLAMALAFPSGGTFPFAGSAFWPGLIVTVVLFAVLPADRRLLRTGVALYGLLLVVSFLVPTAMGGNAARLGALLAGPVAALGLWADRRLLLALCAPFLLYWQWQTPVDDWVQASGDASIEAPYYAGVARFLESHEPTRVEVPFTDNHWESSLLARHVPLARGWERQLDREVNPLFYDGRPLTAQRLRRWVDDVAVGFIALHDAPMDYSGAQEARLVRAGLPWLREVWSDRHWTVYAVQGARPLATGATVVRVGIEDVELDVPRPGTVHLRFRWTPYWRLEGAPGCVRREDGDWTAIDVRGRGRVRLVADFSLARMGATTPRCSPAP